MISIKNIFIHLQDDHPSPSRRSQSAPPGLLGLAAKPRSKRSRRRVAKRWADLVRNSIEIEAARQFEEARCLRRLRSETLTPKLRVVLDARLFLDFKHRVFEDSRDLLCLQLLGVIRERGDVVQFWSADEPLANETMQLMLAEAERMQHVRDDNCFQVVVETVPPFIFKWKSTLTLQGACPFFARAASKLVSDFASCIPSGMRRLLCRQLAINSCRVSITHLGRHLKPGNLSAQGIGPGYCIEVKTLRPSASQ